MRMRAPSSSGTSKVGLGEGISNGIGLSAGRFFRAGTSLAIKAFADLWASRFRGQRLIPDGNQGFVDPVGRRSRFEFSVTASRHACGSQGRPGAAVGTRPLCRRPAGAGRHAARPRHPLAASARRHREDRRRRGAGEGRRLGGHHRRGHRKDFRSVPGRAEVADPSMVARGRSGALRRRAGGAGGGREPLSRRGRRRTGADRICAARSGDRSAGGVQARRRRSCMPKRRPTRFRSASSTTATPRARSRRPTRSSS